MENCQIGSHKEECRSLISELVIECAYVAAKKGIELSDLRFAQPTFEGWSFLEKRNIEWEILDEIIYRVSRRYPKIRIGTIADLLSELVNLKENEFAD